MKVNATIQGHGFFLRLVCLAYLRVDQCHYVQEGVELGYLEGSQPSFSISGLLRAARLVLLLDFLQNR
jgi:hypothetical protein